MLDVALFMANATQLKAVLEQGNSFQYYGVLIALISVSLFFQVVVGILLIVMGKIHCVTIFVLATIPPLMWGEVTWSRVSPCFALLVP